MDDMVLKAMQKWPDVSDCYGWLGLDARGDWYMRDAAVQARGPFASVTGVADGSKGSRLVHQGLMDFIGRNYQHDEKGRWYFQNGPQKVFVELTHAPWVWRIQPDGRVTSHTGVRVNPTRCLVDEQGHAYLLSELGLGLVHSQDMNGLVDALDRGVWPREDVLRSNLPARFQYVPSPQVGESGKRGA